MPVLYHSEKYKEEDDDRSHLGHFQKNFLISSSRMRDFLKNEELNSLYGSALKKKISRLMTGIFAEFYKKLDGLSGRQSCFILDSSQLAGQFYGVIEYLKDKKIINRFFYDDSRFNDAPAFCRFDIEPIFPVGVTDGSRIKAAFGHGFGKNLANTFSKLIGETLERYFTCIYSKKNFIRGSSEDLKNKRLSAMNLDFLAGFDNWQKKYNPSLAFNKTSVFFWEKAVRFSTGKSVYIPAQLLHWNYLLEGNEPCLGEFNTNAAGGWFSLEGAILSGLYELVQRDGFLIHWLNKITPFKVDPHTVPDEKFQELLAESERYGFKIHCLNVTSDIAIPAFAVVVEDSSGKSPKYSLGGGCQADPSRALYRALEEAWSVYYWIRAYRQVEFNIDEKTYSPFVSPVSQENRLSLWANPEMARHYQFFISGKEIPFSEMNFVFPRKFSSGKEELKEAVSRMESFGDGYEVYYYKASHPILNELAYFSAQVVVPKLVPLYLYEQNAPLGAKRLKEVPVKLGFAAAKEFNMWPHPFP